MNNILNDIPEENHSEFLNELLSNYIDKQGLGGIPKTDLDALLVYLYTKYSAYNKFDAFSLGQRFRVKESRIKSLYETGLIKYAGLTEGMAWIEILDKLKATKFELESNEKSQIRFKFENPALYKFVQKRLRIIGATATFSSSYEVLTISLSVFFELLEHVYVENQPEFSTTEMKKIRPLVKTIIKKTGTSLGKKKLKELRGEDGIKTKAGKAIQTASNLIGIGGFIMAML